MTSARSTKIILEATPFYHCVTRCVRRSFLCGTDSESGRDFSHRKKWIVNRIQFLARVFAIKVCAYAVMSNHYHLVLFVNENESKLWTDKQIITRWSDIFPRDAREFEENADLSSAPAKAKIALWRSRLTSISWFMRCVNESLARISNEEDNCKGRFWEGRFKSQALLDEGAVLAAMAYVDLNPIRAKIATTPENSEFTSIYDRIKFMAKELKREKAVKLEQHCENTKQPAHLMAFSNKTNKDNDNIPKIDFSLSNYLELIDTTGRIIRENKRGAIPNTLSPILQRLNLKPKSWIDMVKNLERKFFHAIGNTLVLENFGCNIRSRAPKGSKAARLCYLQVA